MSPKLTTLAIAATAVSAPLLGWGAFADVAAAESNLVLPVARSPLAAARPTASLPHPPSLVAAATVGERPNPLLPGATLPAGPASTHPNNAADGVESLDSRPLVAQTRGVCTSQVGQAIARLAARAGGRWGIRIQTSSGETIYDRGSRNFLIPASNNKLFVTAAALQMFDDRAPIKGSVSLREWVTTTNQRSDNGQADFLFRTVGGFRNIQRALSPLGVNPEAYRMVDGSGLSRSNTTQPQTLVSLLQGMAQAPNGDTFRRSLPIAGVTGTLRRRFVETPAQGRVFAKTGTLTGVRALSGYMAHPLYDRLTFSILANSGASGESMLRSIDGIVLTAMQMRPCELGAPSQPEETTPGVAPNSGWIRPDVAPSDWQQPAPARPAGPLPGDVRPSDWRPPSDRVPSWRRDSFRETTF